MSERRELSTYRRWSWEVYHSGYGWVGRSGLDKARGSSEAGKSLGMADIVTHNADAMICVATREAVEEQAEHGEVGCPICGRPAEDHRD